METVIDCSGLTVTYGMRPWSAGARGIVDVSLEVRAGEVLGLLGPNGAGKTTLLRVLLDLIRPTSGHARILGMDSHRQSIGVRRRLSYLPGEVVLPARLTGREVVELYASARRGSRMIARVTDLAERLDVDLSRRVGDLSRGNRQKVGLVIALAPEVELLVLDEPTSGLDPLLQRAFRDLVRERVSAGGTVLLSSHVMDEVQHLADRVAMMRDGRVVDVDTVEALRMRQAREVRVALRHTDDALALASLLAQLDPSVDGAEVTLRLSGSMDALVKAIARFEVDAIDTVEPDLEDAFISFYGEAS